MENLQKINRRYEKENCFVTKDPQKDLNLSNYNVESFLLNHTTDEQESLKNIIHEDKKKKLKQILWIYEQEYKEKGKLKELKAYGEEFMKLPQDVFFIFFIFFIY